MLMAHATDFVTPRRWRRTLLRFGSPDTYRLAASWLRECSDVADWGGSTGYFRCCLPETVAYTVVDGTRQTLTHNFVLANLTQYHVPSDGILLRHVLDNTLEWQQILDNAVAAFRRRLVVITFTPAAMETHRAKNQCGWPCWHFQPDDLRVRMAPWLVSEQWIHTTHPEHVYYLERRR